DLGMQLLQTDSPWIQTRDRGLDQPLRALAPDAGEDPMKEPGSRFLLHPGEDGEQVFAYRIEPEGSETTWETTVSSGVDERRIGCLRAANGLGPAATESVTVCRTKIPALRATNGMIGPGNPEAEHAVLAIETCHGGTCTMEESRSREPDAGGA